jgi:hypothetical protein
VGFRVRPQAGLEQHLVRPDVAQAGDHALVHQRGLELAALAADPAGKGLGFQREHVRADVVAAQVVRGVVGEFDPPEPAQVGEGEPAAIVEHQVQAAVRGLRRAVVERGQVPGHAEVHDQLPAARKLQEQNLAVALHALDRVAGERGLEIRRVAAAQPLGVVQGDLRDTSVQRLLAQGPRVRLDVRQFGHWVLVPSPCHGAKR